MIRMTDVAHIDVLPAVLLILPELDLQTREVQYCSIL